MCICLVKSIQMLEIHILRKLFVFGSKKIYKQWNAAFDAGQAAALGIPYLTLHPAEHDHALKEVDAGAAGMAREPEQIVQALSYVIKGAMPSA